MKKKYLFHFTNSPCFRTIVLASCLTVPLILFAQKDIGTDNQRLIEQYVSSKGRDVISFDASNIKQFWISNSVISKKDSFELYLETTNKSGFASVPLPIQIINVNETQDCTVEVISENNGLEFSVLDSSSKEISRSSSSEKFLHYNVASSTFHWEDIQKKFFLKFYSKDTLELSIKKVIFSFSKNPKSSFLESPGVIQFNENDVTGGIVRQAISESSFSVSGKRTVLVSNKKILVTDNTVSCSVTIKNITDKPVNIFVGYAPYTKDYNRIQIKNNPYNITGNEILKVVSSERNTNKIIVDSYPMWKKGCYLALNAKEDYVDFPNFSIIESPINEVKKNDETHTEIIFDKPIKDAIPQGISVRVHEFNGDTYLFTAKPRLQAGEEVTLQSSLKKDDNLLLFSPKAFSRGVYYVVPVILSYSIDPNDENTVIISDFKITY